jgi:hypothetical protein
MADECDGVKEALQGQLQMGLMAAGRVAEVAARHREQELRAVEAADREAAQHMRTRMDGQRAAAREVLRPVNAIGRSQWWDAAGPDDIAEAWQSARTWEHDDPVVRLGADRLRRGLRERYGIDVDALTRDSDPDAVRRAIPGGDPVQKPSSDAASRSQQSRAADQARDLEQAQAWAKDHQPQALKAYRESQTWPDMESRDAAEKFLLDQWRNAPQGTAERDADTQRAQSRREQAEAAQLVQDADQADRDQIAQAARAQDAAVGEAGTPRGVDAPGARPSGYSLAHLDPADRDVAAAVMQEVRDKFGIDVQVAEVTPEAHQGAKRAEAVRLYDSAERREDLAASLENVADEETVQARVVADTSQARPAHEAVTAKKSRVPTARPRRGPSARSQQAQRGGPDR